LIPFRHYIGEFKDDLPNGQGTLTFPGVYKYVGGWKNNKFHGQGIYSLPGETYEGEFKDGQYVGK